MRKLFFYIFAGLIFCNIGNTNDIYEYEIEGISIGDSLLEYLKEEEIVKEIQENNALSDEKVTSSLGLLLFSQFLLFIGVGAVIPSIPLYGKELGFSGAANGIVISAPAVALLLLAKFGGNFADKKRKPAMIIGMAIIAISDLGTALCQNLPSFSQAPLEKRYFFLQKKDNHYLLHLQNS